MDRILKEDLGVVSFISIEKFFKEENTVLLSLFEQDDLPEGVKAYPIFESIDFENEIINAYQRAWNTVVIGCGDFEVAKKIGIVVTDNNALALTELLSKIEIDSDSDREPVLILYLFYKVGNKYLGKEFILLNQYMEYGYDKINTKTCLACYARY